MPSSEIKLKVVQGAKHMDADCNPFLPLEVFDNTEYDSRTPEDWLALGKEKDGQKPVPGKALLANGIVKDGVRQYDWMDIGMTAYDKKTKLYQVNDTFFISIIGLYEPLSQGFYFHQVWPYVRVAPIFYPQ